jgi:hypothetical protein
VANSPWEQKEMRPGALTAVVLLALIGCSSHVSVEKEQIAAIKELTEVLGTVKDEATMKAARSELEKRFQRFEEVAKKAKGMGRPSEEVQRQLQEELGPQKERAFDNLRNEVRRITALPGGEAFLKSLGKLR